MFLLKRGLWLVFLELTIVNFAWFFNMQFSLITLFVIWALGIGMIVLAACIHLPFKATLAIGALMVVGHNAFDNFHVEGNGVDAILWSMVHQFQGFPLSKNYFLFIGYPLVPWIGVMMLGYCFGTFYQSSYRQATRRKILLYLGTALVAIFVLIRLINGYGDPHPWSTQPNPVFTVLSFINVTKYPPSLLYVLITLGPAILFLAVSENYYGSISQKIKILGRVPCFITCCICLDTPPGVGRCAATGYDASDMVFNTWVTNSPNLVGYGFNLWVVYVVWISVVLILYPLCKWSTPIKL